jgi:hypothetical protein
MIKVQIAMLGALAVAACSAPSASEPPAVAAVTVRPLNSEPFVSSQSPARPFGGPGRNQVFQTPNSLPPGTATGPGR